MISLDIAFLTSKTILVLATPTFLPLSYFYLIANEESTLAFALVPSPLLVLVADLEIHQVNSSLSPLTLVLSPPSKPSLHTCSFLPQYLLLIWDYTQVLSLYLTTNAFIHTHWSLCTIFNESNYISWSFSFHHFLYVHFCLFDIFYTSSSWTYVARGP